MLSCRGIGMVLAFLALAAGSPATLLGSYCEAHEAFCQPAHEPEAKGEDAHCCCTATTDREGNQEAVAAVDETPMEGCDHQCSFVEKGPKLLYLAPGTHRPPVPDNTELSDAFERFTEAPTVASRPIGDDPARRSPPPPPQRTVLALLQVSLT